MNNTKTKNFHNHCDYLEKLCEKTNTEYHKYDVGFSIYPDGYSNTNDKNYFLIMIKIKKCGNKIGIINHKDCSEEELLKHLTDFKNGIINDDFCLNNITDYRSDDDNYDDFIYVEGVQ